MIENDFLTRFERGQTVAGLHRLECEDIDFMGGLTDCAEGKSVQLLFRVLRTKVSHLSHLNLCMARPAKPR